MKRIKETDGCIKCGNTTKENLGFIGIDENGNKIMMKICLICLVKEAEKQLLKGEGEQETESTTYTAHGTNGETIEWEEEHDGVGADFAKTEKSRGETDPESVQSRI